MLFRLLVFLAAANFALGQAAHVAANRTEIRITSAEAGPVDILEVAPHETVSVATNKVGRITKGTLTIPRFDSARDRLYSGFLVVRPGSRSPVGGIHYVEKFDDISRSTAPFPVATSKKGLQIQMADDAIALGVKHAAVNINLTGLVDLDHRPQNYSWVMDGETYFFNRPYLDSLRVAQLSEAGMVVSLIVLAYQGNDPARNALMLDPRCVAHPPNRIGAFNISTADGSRHYRAALEFLADHFSGRDPGPGRVVNYIIGNEVDSHWQWYNLGSAPADLVASHYLRALRQAATAVRKSSSTARVYISLDHFWNRAMNNDPGQCLPGRQLLETMARLSREEGDFDWHIAYHPYPENLFNPRTWDDKTAAPGADTPRITFKNLDLLPRLLDTPELRFGGRPRRVILSEQGFHSDGTPAGEELQAAAFCYAYYKTVHLEGIDSFIMNRHVDHQAEGGLNLGVWTRKPESVATPDRRKKLYEVFRLADTPQWEDAFAFALPIIGMTNWSQTMAP